MKVTRHLDANLINEILNHPEVRPDISETPDGPVDITAAVANTDNVLLLGEYGGVFFIKLLPGIYEAHTQAVPEGRGAWIVECVDKAVRYLFTHTDAYEIVTRIPETHVAARRLAQRTGLRFEFRRPAECKWRGQVQACEIYSFRIQDWAQRCDLETKGHAFHDFLHAEASRIGITTPAHEDDPQHNRYLGIALAMIEGGQPGKAVSFYNRWALASRHAIVRFITDKPVTIGFDIGNLIFDAGTWRVEPMDIAA